MRDPGLYQPTPVGCDAVILFLFGIATSVLALGGIVATIAVWEWAPLGAQLALVVLDVAVGIFVLATLAAIVLKLSRLESRGSNRDDDRQNSQRRPQTIPLQAIRQMANELNASLVRRRDGSYQLRIGPVQGRAPFRRQVSWPEQYNLEEVESKTYAWLSMLADSLDAELLYDGRQMEWYLHWPDVLNVEEDNR